MVVWYSYYCIFLSYHFKEGEEKTTENENKIIAVVLIEVSILIIVLLC